MNTSNSGQTEKVVTARWRRVRPLWSTVVLSVVTLGFYCFFWYWATWRELKQETKEKSMRPFWHLLSLFVPVYQLFQVFAHFKAIKKLGVQHSRIQDVVFVAVSPGLMLFLFLVAGFLIRLSAYLSAEGAYSDLPWWYGSGLLVLGTILGFHAFPYGPPQGTVHLGCCVRMNPETYYAELPLYFYLV